MKRRVPRQLNSITSCKSDWKEVHRLFEVLPASRHNVGPAIQLLKTV